MLSIFIFKNRDFVNHEMVSTGVYLQQ